jgi:MtfA peptidase
MQQLHLLLQTHQDQDDLGQLIFYGFMMAITVVAIVIVAEYIRYRIGSAAPVTIRFLKIKPEYRTALEKHFQYYKKLDRKEKDLFEKRVQYFINIKKFIPRNLQEVTSEMKALIAGAAIQLTFGLPQVYFSHFDKIIVYPDEYYSLINRKKHKGEVNVRSGIIVLSWKYFVQGYIDPDDSINLGLHEMAHALKLENRILNREYGFLDEKILAQWDRLADAEIKMGRCGDNAFFRKYACENKHEFFAVAVENFFERPRELNDYNNDIYMTMSRLLNQDVLRMDDKKGKKVL